MDRGEGEAVRKKITEMLLEAGASEVGFSQVRQLTDSEMSPFTNWLNAGMNAGMDYMARNTDIRRNPALLLPDAKTIISLAFPYYPSAIRKPSLPYIALYAYGEDYHKVIRRRLKPVARQIEHLYDCTTRICIDSAPLLERFWALNSGIGLLGENRTLITKKHGSYAFLAFILTTLNLPYSETSKMRCRGCKECLRACPTGALTPYGIDARKCLSYLTIEHQGELSHEARQALNTIEGKNTFFGCDICQRVCPHNADAIPTQIPEFQPSDMILSLDPAGIENLTDEEKLTLFRSSSLARKYRPSSKD